MTYRWKKADAEARIDSKLSDVESVDIVDYKRDLSLDNIPTNRAYRINGVHLYVDILNLSRILGTESETAHKRALRFLNQHYRAVHRILSRVDAIRVDFHNQRLHAVVAKPYDTEDGAEAKRIQRAIATGQLIIDVLEDVGNEDNKVDPADVRIGIDSGAALAVNNGRAGQREPLFLGSPANHAAKRAGGGTKPGIFLTGAARDVIGLTSVDDENATPLTTEEITASFAEAKLGISKDEIITEWRADLKDNPIGDFEFSRHTPPFRDLGIDELTPSNSRRQEAVSIYGDIDGFTAYVDQQIEGNAEDVVRCLHVIRAEMDAVLSADFGGQKIRFIGDCIHGVIAEGTAQTTDDEASITNALLCAGALRSSFDLALAKLAKKKVACDGIGLQVGLEYGMVTVTRLGMKGNRVRCAASCSVLTSEKEQTRCSGDETAIGEAAYKAGTSAVRALFGTTRKASGLDYDTVVLELEAGGDRVAKAAKDAAVATVYAPAAVTSLGSSIRSHSGI
jgi:class 3 adenylate cyclase